MPSSAFLKFETASTEAVDFAGRKNSDAVTYKAAIVLLAAAWEIYVERVIKEGAEFLVNGAVNSGVIPQRLKLSVANKNVRDGKQKNPLFAWLFTEDLWKEQLLQFVEREVENLNTPDSVRVKQLFARCLDHSDITRCWGRQGLRPPKGKNTAEKAADTLDEWLDFRHSIAHGSNEYRFIKADVLAFKRFLDITIRNTERELASHLKSLAGQSPW